MPLPLPDDFHSVSPSTRTVTPRTWKVPTPGEVSTGFDGAPCSRTFERKETFLARSTPWASSVAFGLHLRAGEQVLGQAVLPDGGRRGRDLLRADDEGHRVAARHDSLDLGLVVLGAVPGVLELDGGGGERSGQRLRRRANLDEGIRPGSLREAWRRWPASPGRGRRRPGSSGGRRPGAPRRPPGWRRSPSPRSPRGFPLPSRCGWRGWRRTRSCGRRRGRARPAGSSPRAGFRPRTRSRSRSRPRAPPRACGCRRGRRPCRAGRRRRRRWRPGRRDRGSRRGCGPPDPCAARPRCASRPRRGPRPGWCRSERHSLSVEIDC